MYSELYFGKEITKLAIEDIEKFFIEEKEESDKIEFKSYADEYGNLKEKEAGILRTICSFLNSEGGLLIWGAPAGRPHEEDSKRKIFTGQLTSFEKFYEKDKFINKITDSITPVANAIQFERIESAGRYVYIFEVAKSPYSPHQFQNIYYMRLDGQTVKAPHHYIEALFKKITYPKLSGFLSIHSAVVEPHETNPSITMMNFVLGYCIMNLSPLQNEYNISLKIQTTKGFFPRGGTLRGDVQYTNENKIFLLPTARNILFYGQPLIDTERFSIRIDNIENPIIKIILFFGGKSSPIIVSEYEIDVDKIPKRGDFNLMIVNKKEDQYLHELIGHAKDNKDIESNIREYFKN